MATYLPKDTSPGSAYQEGGGLYALGLIHANHGGDIIDYLLSQLKNASNDVSGLNSKIRICSRRANEWPISDLTLGSGFEVVCNSTAVVFVLSIDCPSRRWSGSGLGCAGHREAGRV